MLSWKRRDGKKYLRNVLLFINSIKASSTWAVSRVTILSSQRRSLSFSRFHQFLRRKNDGESNANRHLAYMCKLFSGIKKKLWRNLTFVLITAQDNSFPKKKTGLAPNIALMNYEQPSQKTCLYAKPFTYCYYKYTLMDARSFNIKNKKFPQKKIISFCCSKS